MKKLLIIVLVVALALTTFSACTTEKTPKTGVAYGAVHGGGYVGKSTVTVLDGKVTAATLDEACFPTQVNATADVAELDKVVVGEGTTAKSYYKTVKFAGVVATFDVSEYKVDGVSFKTWVLTPANAQKYYDAVVANGVEVVVAGVNNKTIMTSKTLLKSLNGYGGTKFDWQKNATATIDYVVKNGFAAAESLTYDKDSKTWTDSNKVVATGATWVDLNVTKDGYLSYIKLMSNAFDNAKA